MDSADDLTFVARRYFEAAAAGNVAGWAAEHVDELAGFITAVALMRPEGLAGMQAKSVRKKMKQKSFAAAVKRGVQTRILTDLGFTVSETADAFDCAVPSWRPDVRGEADLVEEVCRIYGLDKVPPAPLPRAFAVARPVLSQLQRRMIAARISRAPTSRNGSGGIQRGVPNRRGMSGMSRPCMLPR